jgi:hypothetical protein
MSRLLFLAVIITISCRSPRAHDQPLDKLADSFLTGVEFSCRTLWNLPAECMGIKADTTAYYYTDSAGHVVEFGFELDSARAGEPHGKSAGIIGTALDSSYSVGRYCGAGASEWIGPTFRVRMKLAYALQWGWTTLPLDHCALREIPRWR